MTGELIIENINARKKIEKSLLEPYHYLISENKKTLSEWKRNMDAYGFKKIAKKFFSVFLNVDIDEVKDKDIEELCAKHGDVEVFFVDTFLKSEFFLDVITTQLIPSYSEDVSGNKGYPCEMIELDTDGDTIIIYHMRLDAKMDNASVDNTKNRLKLFINRSKGNIIKYEKVYAGC